MLERNFNKLDDDFITLWSNCILYANTTEIIKPLERLAEKGQINAIQSWYLIKRPEEKNEKIDAIVDGYYGDEMNEALAIAHKIYDRDRAYIDDLRKKMTSSQIKLDIAKNYEAYNLYYNQLNELIDKYQNTDYAKQMIEASELTLATAERTQSSRVWERLFEIYKGNPTIFEEEVSKKDIKTIRECLGEHFANNPDDYDVKYALAKNLFFFPQRAAHKIRGQELLKELAQRPLHIDSQMENDCEMETN